MIPLHIKDSGLSPVLEISLYELEDGQRVLEVMDFARVLGLVDCGLPVTRAFLGVSEFRAFVHKDLARGLETPVCFFSNGLVRRGYPAELVVYACQAILAAWATGKLPAHRRPLANRADGLLRELALVGIRHLPLTKGE